MVKLDVYFLLGGVILLLATVPGASGSCDFSSLGLRIYDECLSNHSDVQSLMAIFNYTAGLLGEGDGDGEKDGHDDKQSLRIRRQAEDTTDYDFSTIEDGVTDEEAEVTTTEQNSEMENQDGITWNQETTTTLDDTNTEEDSDTPVTTHASAESTTPHVDSPNTDPKNDSHVPPEYTGPPLSGPWDDLLTFIQNTAQGKTTPDTLIAVVAEFLPLVGQFEPYGPYIISSFLESHGDEVAYILGLDQYNMTGRVIREMLRVNESVVLSHFDGYCSSNSKGVAMSQCLVRVLSEPGECSSDEYVMMVNNALDTAKARYCNGNEFSPSVRQLLQSDHGNMFAVLDCLNIYNTTILGQWGESLLMSLFSNCNFAHFETIFSYVTIELQRMMSSEPMQRILNMAAPLLEMDMNNTMSMMDMNMSSTADPLSSIVLPAMSDLLTLAESVRKLARPFSTCAYKSLVDACSWFDGSLTKWMAHLELITRVTAPGIFMRDIIAVAQSTLDIQITKTVAAFGDVHVIDASGDVVACHHPGENMYLLNRYFMVMAHHSTPTAHDSAHSRGSGTNHTGYLDGSPFDRMNVSISGNSTSMMETMTGNTSMDGMLKTLGSGMMSSGNQSSANGTQMMMIGQQPGFTYGEHVKITGIRVVFFNTSDTAVAFDQPALPVASWYVDMYNPMSQTAFLCYPSDAACGTSVSLGSGSPVTMAVSGSVVTINHPVSGTVMEFHTAHNEMKVEVTAPAKLLDESYGMLNWGCLADKKQHMGLVASPQCEEACSALPEEQHRISCGAECTRTNSTEVARQYETIFGTAGPTDAASSTTTSTTTDVKVENAESGSERLQMVSVGSVFLCLMSLSLWMMQ